MAGLVPGSYISYLLSSLLYPCRVHFATPIVQMVDFATPIVQMGVKEVNGVGCEVYLSESQVCLSLAV